MECAFGDFEGAAKSDLGQEAAVSRLCALPASVLAWNCELLVSIRSVKGLTRESQMPNSNSLGNPCKGWRSNQEVS